MLISTWFHSVKSQRVKTAQKTHVSNSNYDTMQSLYNFVLGPYEWTVFKNCVIKRQCFKGIIGK